ncbi:MAG: tetratricopeptide repeat protein [Terracidiphilus sp.]|jgi:hypothetical protein
MTIFWKNATAILCGAVVCAAAITWQAHRVKSNERKLAEAATACRARAEKGEAKAESELGSKYYYGQGVPQDYDEALRWCRKAADQGDAKGQYGVGYMNLYGFGVPRDEAEALRWFRKAADQGDAKAQTEVALMYDEGLGVTQDYAEALRWYRKAVDQSYAGAEYNLGNMYYYGHGVPQDYAEAVRWYGKAADQGDEYAQGFLHRNLRGMGTCRKISLSILFIGCSFFLIGSLVPGRNSRNGKQRTIIVPGLLGLSYLASDLLEFRYIGVLTPASVFCAFHFFKSLLAGSTVALLLQVVLPARVWPKVAKGAMGVFGVLFIGFNLFLIVIQKLRGTPWPLRACWGSNGDLLGMIAAFSLILWWMQRRAKFGQDNDDDVTLSGPNVETNNEDGLSV